jgi:hypothetical protein
VTKIGSFKIETSFNVSNRGIVAVGQIIEGLPKLGRYISVDISGRKEVLKITGIERGNPDENGIIKFGLLLQIDDPLLIKHIAENKLKEQVSSIFEDN